MPDEQEADAGSTMPFSRVQRFDGGLIANATSHLGLARLHGRCNPVHDLLFSLLCPAGKLQELQERGLRAMHANMCQRRFVRPTCNIAEEANSVQIQYFPVPYFRSIVVGVVIQLCSFTRTDNKISTFPDDRLNRKEEIRSHGLWQNTEREEQHYGGNQLTGFHSSNLTDDRCLVSKRTNKSAQGTSKTMAP
ncbi:uncharacterized protein BDZ83DRAFT_655062 [Colletotrichum acutatum]|uniref:Uncharacterized protein n=1 Tax=Glomerella acutata TaxID=27357 RepID=A0AAD8UGH8_GLOAC|nr:uncharacterized protein BDZ83DRAFT_655062 [Colletotrichum acutatum]KAK1718173.1 hypothetical protein BDZ83DRAFT_655062 [Colletotrichum acutatum]